MIEEPQHILLGVRPPPRIGPYEVSRVLGRGGMGVVYHGRDARTGAAVAVKTVERVRDGHVASIRREIHTLASLSHEGVVRIERHGVSRGLPWYAMELLTGYTLRDLLSTTQSAPSARGTVTCATETRGVAELARRSAEARSVEHSQVRRWARSSGRIAELLAVIHGVCEVLAYLHERGVVHRDLKPENIFVRGDGSPVLVDFGISARFAGSFGREELDAPAIGVGTVAYMAPEQIEGEFVDARADLYALGCILYECLTGEPPFAGVSPPAVLRAHLKQSPLAPSLLVDDVPPELDRLVLQLLEKEPGRRLGFADDVARAIRSAPQGRALTVRAQAAPYLYRPAFVGRRAVFGELRDSLRALVRERRGGRVSLGGESGVGKTRLAMEVVREATGLGVRAVLSRCLRLSIEQSAVNNEAPLQAFSPLLVAVADRCCDFGPAETARLLGARGKVLASYFPCLIDTPGYPELPEAPPLPPKEARARVLAGAAATLFAFAQRQPVLLVIDDVQWADELSLCLLSLLTTERLAQNGVLVLGTYRMDDASRGVAEVMRAPRARHLELSRFGLGEVSALVRGMLALEHSPLNLVVNLQRKCSGNPFFVVEYLRSAIADGLLTREAGRWRLESLGDLFELGEVPLVVPDGISSLLDRRLNDLDDAAIELVQAAAVLGREFEADLLAACVASSGSVTAEALERLRQRQIIEDAEDGRLRFVHDAIRENAYRRMLGSASRELHRRAAWALAPRSTRDPWALRAVAHHFSRAGESDPARTYYLEAGEFAAERYANADAIVCFEAALREPVAPEEATTPEPLILEKLGDVVSITGQHDVARGAYERALSALPPREFVAESRLHRKVGKSWETHHDHEQARASYDCATRALFAADVVPSRDWWRELVQVSLDRLWVCYWLNLVDEMDALAASSRATIEEHGDTFQKARFLQLLVMLETRRERCLVSEKTVELARRASLAGRSLSAADRATLDFVLFFTLVLHGSLDEAEVEGRAVLRWANQGGAATLKTRCLTYLMLTARRRGDVAEVLRLSHDCAASCAAASMGEYLGALKANLAWVAARQGRHEEAKQLGNAALLAWKSVKVPYPLQWLARFPLLALSVEEGDLKMAAEHARRLLDPEQQRLESSIVDALRSGTESASVDARARLALLGTAIDGARDLLYL